MNAKIANRKDFTEETDKFRFFEDLRN